MSMPLALALRALLALVCMLALAGAAHAAPADRLLAEVPDLTDFEAPQARATYVGALPGTKAAVAVVVRGGTAVGYICDGKRISVWLRGTVRDGRLRLTGERETLVVALLARGRVTGTVRLHGARARSFVARPATATLRLFRSRIADGDQSLLTGWIFGPGKVRGATEVGLGPGATVEGVEVELDRCRALRFREAQLSRVARTTRAIQAELAEVRAAIEEHC
jgi:hypothetical protein